MDELSKLVSYFNNIPTLEVKDVTDFITKNVPEYHCPVCGGKDFEVLSDDGKYVTILGIQECRFTPNGHGQTITQTSNPKGFYIQFHCKKCHFVCNHNYVTLRAAVVNERMEKAIHERSQE